TDFFDAVVIIRGGGSQAELSCFDNYRIAYHITQFPLPVISGIGHERDETIVDRVAYISVKTPTAAAEFLIEKFQSVYDKLQEYQNMLVNFSTDILQKQYDLLNILQVKSASIAKDAIFSTKTKISLVAQQFSNSIQNYIYDRKNEFSFIYERIKPYMTRFLVLKNKELERLLILLKFNSTKYIENKKHLLEMHNLRAIHFDPLNVMKRGYSITKYNGKTLKSIHDINQGDKILTVLIDGKLGSIINECEM
ncbi:MAG: hypothetical protein HY738_19385, partial [Bacteroidia bacterium]|nr:hypothetical protein [Bacteroidia bacterium]